MDERLLSEVLNEQAAALTGGREDEESLLTRYPQERNSLQRLFRLARQTRAVLVQVEPSERFVRRLGTRLVVRSRRRLVQNKRRLARSQRRLARRTRRLARRARGLQGARIWRLVGALSLVVVWMVTIVVAILGLVARILWSIIGLLSLLLIRRRRAMAPA